MIDILEYYFIFISELDTMGYNWDTILDCYYGHYSPELSTQDVEKIDEIVSIMRTRETDVVDYQSKLADDIVTNDFIDNGHNYFGLPNLTEALSDLSA